MLRCCAFYTSVYHLITQVGQTDKTYLSARSPPAEYRLTRKLVVTQPTVTSSILNDLKREKYLSSVLSCCISSAHRADNTNNGFELTLRWSKQINETSWMDMSRLKLTINQQMSHQRGFFSTYFSLLFVEQIHSANRLDVRDCSKNNKFCLLLGDEDCTFLWKPTAWNEQHWLRA